jgi:hypothetical protein
VELAPLDEPVGESDVDVPLAVFDASVSVVPLVVDDPSRLPTAERTTLPGFEPLFVDHLDGSVLLEPVREVCCVADAWPVSSLTRAGCALFSAIAGCVLCDVVVRVSTGSSATPN